LLNLIEKHQFVERGALIQKGALIINYLIKTNVTSSIIETNHVYLFIGLILDLSRIN